MKLSEAILLGSTLYKQCTGGWFRTDGETPGEVTVCGLGAASSSIEEFDTKNMVAPWCLSQIELDRRRDVLKEKYPFMLVNFEKHNFKVKGNYIYVDNIAQAIVYMNDTLRFSLQQIAEQVAEWEREHPEWYESTEGSQNTLQTECPQESLVSS